MDAVEHRCGFCANVCECCIAIHALGRQKCLSHHLSSRLQICLNRCCGVVLVVFTVFRHAKLFRKPLSSHAMVHQQASSQVARQGRCCHNCFVWLHTTCYTVLSNENIAQGRDHADFPPPLVFLSGQPQPTFTTTWTSWAESTQQGPGPTPPITTQCLCGTPAAK